MAVKKKKVAPRQSASRRSKKRVLGRPYFVHPQGLVDDGAQIGQGTRVWAFAHVTRDARVGANCNICDGVFIEGGVVLGDRVTVKNGVQLYTGVTTEDFVFIGPNATFTNDLRPRVARPLRPEAFAKTHLSYGVSIGANATIVAGTRMGRNAMVGAGTVVIRDVPAHALVVGNPARQIGWVCSCGQRLNPDFACSGCSEVFELVNKAQGLVPRAA